MAGRFRFRLEVVRRIRQQAQDRQRCVVADGVRTVSTAERRIDRLNQELRDTLDRALSARRAKRLDIVSLCADQFYCGCLHHRIVQSGADRAALVAELDRERVKLGEVAKRLKVIEKLRERQWTRYLEESGRQERAAFDESAVQLHVRKRHAERGEAGES